MSEACHRTIDLREYEEVFLLADEVSPALGEGIWREYGDKLEVEFPTPKTGNRWQLKSLGWVGHIPVSDAVSLYLGPKVSLSNLFRLLEYAYNLDIHILEGMTHCESLKEFYERLANILARRVLARGRRGYYRAYLHRTEALPYVRGRLDVRAAMRRPWDVALDCRFDDQTPDVEENQILLWSLSRIARSNMCTERVLPTVRKAYRQLLGFATLKPFDPAVCVDRLYNRLNDDYEALHGLCRFFLEHTGPGHRVGDRTMLPFLIDMARLFELFVAQWLMKHVPDEIAVRAQERVNIGDGKVIHFNIDLVLEERATGQPVCVIDTKYKTPEAPATSDVSQVVTYALSKGCSEAVLAYPTMPAKPLDDVIGDPGIRVRTLEFRVDGEIEAAGRSFLVALLAGGD